MFVLFREFCEVRVSLFPQIVRRIQCPAGQFFNARLELILNSKHPLFVLANQIVWDAFDEEFGNLYSDRGHTVVVEGDQNQLLEVGVVTTGQRAGSVRIDRSRSLGVEPVELGEKLENETAARHVMISQESGAWRADMS